MLLCRRGGGRQGRRETPRHSVFICVKLLLISQRISEYGHQTYKFEYLPYIWNVFTQAIIPKAGLGWYIKFRIFFSKFVLSVIIHVKKKALPSSH